MFETDSGKTVYAISICSYTSIFTDKLVYPEPSKDFHELTEHTNCYYMLDRLQHKRYNPIREDARFKAVIHALQEYAK